MNRAFLQFEDAIRRALDLSVTYNHCSSTMTSTSSCDDILRFQLVYGVSAFDKLIHRLVRIGMVETFSGSRTATEKYKTEGISLATFALIGAATMPPREYYFEQEIIQRHKHLSFQDPAKVAEALSLIWDESHKWVKIASEMGMVDGVVKTTLKTICSRRNSIVHEADIDPSTETQISITLSDSEDAVNFLKKCGQAIYNLVK